MIKRISPKLASLAIGGIMAAGAATTVATPAQADLIIRIGNGIQFTTNRHYCGAFNRVPVSTVRFRAYQAGYSFVRNTQLVRYSRTGYNNCGVYRSLATRYGRNYVIFSSVNTGRVIHVRYAGTIAPRPFPRPYPVLNSYQVRVKLFQQGYRNVRFVQLHRTVYRPAGLYGRPYVRGYYTAVAQKFLFTYRVYVNAQTGRVFRHVRIR